MELAPQRRGELAGAAERARWARQLRAARSGPRAGGRTRRERRRSSDDAGRATGTPANSYRAPKQSSAAPEMNPLRTKVAASMAVLMNRARIRADTNRRYRYDDIAVPDLGDAGDAGWLQLRR